MAKLSARIAQFRVAFQATRAADPHFMPWIIGVPLAVLAVCALLGIVVGPLAVWLGLGVGLAICAALIVFGRRATAAQIAAIEGQPGAAAAVLQSMRGPWRVTPAVAATRKQDLVHRVVGRPGIVMVGEGSPARVSALLKQERRRVARAAGDVPVHEISVGDRDKQVPLSKLQFHLGKLPNVIKAREVGPLDTRLSALGDAQLPLPKGPMPGQIRRKIR